MSFINSKSSRMGLRPSFAFNNRNIGRRDSKSTISLLVATTSANCCRLSKTFHSERVKAKSLVNHSVASSAEMRSDCPPLPRCFSAELHRVAWRAEFVGPIKKAGLERKGEVRNFETDLFRESSRNFNSRLYRICNRAKRRRRL